MPHARAHVVGLVRWRQQGCRTGLYAHLKTCACHVVLVLVRRHHDLRIASTARLRGIRGRLSRREVGAHQTIRLPHVRHQR